MEYQEFIRSKEHAINLHGFEPVFMPDYLKDFQKHIIGWAVNKGRCAIFADCGLGKTIMQLVWAENIIRKHGGKVLILTPLAVGAQTEKEAIKFGINAKRVTNGEVAENISVTNYEQLHHYNREDFIACVCDESSILKNFKGAYKEEITEFMKKMSFRLLCTATAAPNDYIELGTSSEAIGELGFMDMLGMFFKNDLNPTVETKRRFAAQGGEVPKWRFKRHAEIQFWKWVSSWAIAIRKPSDLGFSDEGYNLKPIITNEHILDISRPVNGALFAMPAKCLKDQRAERRATIEDRCELAARLALQQDCSILWCHLNDEGNLLQDKLGKDCVQLCGSMSDEKKEEALLKFMNCEVKYLVTKPMCAGFGLNMQHCNHMTFFPSHSYEQYYQSVRRCWRFGQEREVTVDIVSTEGEEAVIKNLQKKSNAAEKMFEKLIMCINDAKSIDKKNIYTNKEEMPEWL